jgi:hypothetical protein
MNTETKTEIITPRLIFDTLLANQGTYFDTIVRRDSHEKFPKPHTQAYGLGGSMVYAAQSNNPNVPILGIYAGNVVMEMYDEKPLMLTYQSLVEPAGGGGAALARLAQTNPIAEKLANNFKRSKGTIAVGGVTGLGLDAFKLSDIEAFIMSHFARE